MIHIFELFVHLILHVIMKTFKEWLNQWVLIDNRFLLFFKLKQVVAELSSVGH